MQGQVSTLSQTKQKSSNDDSKMEIMMMKRMNYIRSNLESHNPRELTSKIRQDAKAKRDERILELWKKETDYPNVTELV